MQVQIAAFYQFTSFADPDGLRVALRDVAAQGDVRGTILVASEGINGTIAGRDNSVGVVLDHIRRLPGCTELEPKLSFSDEQPFRRLKVRLKREIVTLGVDADPTRSVGTYVEPEDWNDVICDRDTVVIDTRNDYEVRVGTFRNALDPKTASFGEFPDWWAEHRHTFDGKRIAMFCTGGIRCEKASSWLLDQGVPEVLHLKGGILNYLEQVPAELSIWEGECYVFDDRVSVAHGVVPGTYTMCHACGRPVSKADREQPAWRNGVSCPACIDEYSDEDRVRFAERQRQVDAGEF